MSAKYGASKLTKAFKLLFKQAKTFNKDTVKLAGQDHLGNKYFEAHRPNHSRPTQRYYDKPQHPQSFDDMIEAVHVPPAWDAWLRFRRREPPSKEEVLEGEEYYQMQQGMAASKKEEEPLNPATSFSDGPKERRKIPTGHYRQKLD